jgi:uncharacterized ferritin-like protein (DUF455 family)
MLIHNPLKQMPLSASASLEVRNWCIRILSATTLEEKLFSPTILTDENPGPALYWDTPSRPVGMEFKKKSKEEKLPPFHEHADADKRAACLHRFAGHELLAVEMMAFSLLAFPEAPKHFRKGLCATLKEEQEHVRLYCARLKQMGVEFGDMPLYKHFWAHTPFIRSPLQYVSMMSLTFEQANLDFAPLYCKSFSKQGDTLSAELMQRILDDEIGHVSFGMHWLQKLKTPEESSWDAWRNSLPERLTIKRAKGFLVFEEHRRKAHIPEDWIQKIKTS